MWCVGLALCGRLRFALVVMLALVAAPVLVHAESPLVAGLQLEGDVKRTKLVVEVSEATGFSISVEPAPYRVLIDIADAQFALPSGVGRKRKGLVKQLRYGKSIDGKPQIVADVTGPVLIEKSYATGKAGNGKSRIVIDLVATSPEIFSAILERDKKADESGAARPADVTASLPLLIPRNGNRNTPAAPKPHKQRTIVIDPGHGGIDPGAISPKKTREKDVVFAFAKALEEKLLALGGYSVRLTRKGDSFLSLKARVQVAREAQADLFIAIHADTVRGQTVTGTTLYTLSEKASDAEAEALAQKENKADVIGGIDMGQQNEQVADILIDLVQRESKNHALLFSRSALEQLQGVTTMTGKPLRSAGFMVLRAPDVPSVLIELGYLSSAEDEKKLLSAVWRGRMAEALARAVDRHFAEAVAAAAP
jgi:N-acetylmuramoyl-L-alanine amidase